MLKKVATRPLNSLKPFAPPLRLFAVYRKYTKEHDWLEYDTDTREAKIGLTNMALQEFGHLTNVQIANVGTRFDKNDCIYDIELKKQGQANIKAVFRGEVKAHNPRLEDQVVDIINYLPESNGWILKAEVLDIWPITELMDEAQYQKYCDTLPKILSDSDSSNSFGMDLLIMLCLYRLIKLAVFILFVILNILGKQKVQLKAQEEEGAAQTVLQNEELVKQIEIFDEKIIDELNEKGDD